jgi:hypothetical protein
MAYGNLITLEGKKIALNRVFKETPDYTAPAHFKVGIGDATPDNGDTDLETPVIVSENDSGTTTSTSANHLVETGQNFTSTVDVGDIVMNTTDNTWAYVTQVNSNTDLTLSSDIMVSGENYIVGTSKKVIDTSYPVFDENNLQATISCTLLGLEGNGNIITEFGLFNDDTTNKCFSRAVFEGITKDESVQLIFVEKDMII